MGFGGLRGQRFGGLGGRRFLQRGPLLRRRLRLRARFGRCLRTSDRLEVEDGGVRLFLARLLFRAEREQQEQQEPFDQQGEADGERASSSPGAKPFDQGSGWKRSRLKQCVFAGGVCGTPAPGDMCEE
jgi:hypothetical protein